MFKILAVAAMIGAGLALPAGPALAANNSPDFLIDGCRSTLQGQPRFVRKEAVQAIGPDAQVSVIPFCMGVQFMDFGNAAGLGKTIAANPVLAKALQRRGWRADDVTGIVISGKSVRLYVHRE